MTDREAHMREQIVAIRHLCENRAWGEAALRTRNTKLMASVPTLLDWLTEVLDENGELRRAVDKALPGEAK